MIIPDTIYNTVKLYPEKEAIVCSGARFTYKQFKERIDLLSAALHQADIRKGDKVALLHTNCHTVMELYYAVAQVGAVLVPLNIRLSPAELAYMLEDSHSKVLFSQHRFAELVTKIRDGMHGIERIIWSQSPGGFDPKTRECSYEHFMRSATEIVYVEENISPEDIAQIYYTSGSTGRPKGVIMTHKNMTTHAMGTIVEYQVTDEDVWFHVAPLFHMSDACNLWAMTWSGGKHVLIDKVEPSRMLDFIEREGITMLKLVPTMWNMLLSDPSVAERDYHSLRLVVSGGSPISPDLIRKIIKTFGCEYVQNYGMTEATHFLTISRLKDKLKRRSQEEQLKYRSKTGRPFLGVKIRVVDENDQDVTPDGIQVGQIIAKGDIITPGYWRMPEENERAFRDGWLYTGDLATIDEEGYINIVDRKKDMIVTGGENVFCIEVENVLYTHRDVQEAAVIGVPHPKWGEAVKAICVLKEAASVNEDEMIQFCKERLAHYKTPKSVDYVKSLPKTGSGKIDKKVLKQKYWKGSSRGVA